MALGKVLRHRRKPWRAYLRLWESATGNEGNVKIMWLRKTFTGWTLTVYM